MVSRTDHSLFVKKIGDSITIILIYVDDIIITRNDQEEIKKVRSQLKEKFDIKDLGLLKYFLEIEIAHSLKGLLFHKENTPLTY
jgi:Reverse transcriptase (RNA-dependent DNA polymerase)